MSALAVYANDGVYLTRGGIIYPTKETKIAIEKEVLSFQVQNGMCTVNILFDFNNPENVERKLSVGFQAPTAAGDVSDHIAGTNQIGNFRIMANGEMLPYTLKAAECEDCALLDPKEVSFSQSENGVFVYLFELTFKPGLNRINHSYTFPASKNVLYDQMYNYILTTGAKWAGGTIKDLTVQMDLGSNAYFYVNDIFGKTANWSVVGSGKVTRKSIENDEESARMIRVISGKLQIEVKAFKPEKNIEFGIICNHSFVTQVTDETALNAGKVWSICGLSLDPEQPYAKETLRILRNTVYAQYGYAFSNKELKAYFMQFDWYIPDPNLKMEQIKLTSEETQFLEAIRLKEQE